MSYIGVKPTIGNFQICDAISVVNGQAAYTMQVGGVNVSPQSANHMIVSLNGTIQKPGSSFTVSGSTITFASNLATGDVIDFIQILGDVLDLGVPSDATVTAAKLNNDIISGSAELASEPADTDEFLVSDAGTLKRIDYSLIKGGGKVLQVVTATDDTARSTTSTSFVTASNTLSVSITPSSTSSKVLILVSSSGKCNGNSSGFFTVYRGSTNLGHSTNGFIRTTDGNVDVSVGLGINYLDSPSTTSATTYQVYMRASANTVFLQSNTCRGVITAMEIGA